MNTWSTFPARLSFLLFVALTCALTAPAATTRGGKESLRKLLKLPQLQAQFSLRFGGSDGFVLTGEEQDAAIEIASLQKQMQRTPADAARHFRLSELHRKIGDETRSTNALARAVELYRRQVDAQSENAELLSQFGLALSADGSEAEAETVLRRALKLAPNHWKCWSAIGEFHWRKSIGALGGGFTNKGQQSMELLLDAAAKRTIPAAGMEQAEKSLDEALNCAAQAIKFGPRESRPYSDRAQILCYAGMQRYLKQVLQGEEADVTKFYQAMFTTNALADLQRMAEFTSDGPSVVTEVIMFEMMSAAIHLGKNGMAVLASGELWNQLSESTRRSIRQNLTRLENLGQSGNTNISARALEYLGGLQWLMMRDQNGAEKNLRRAVALDPTRELAWSFLMGLLVTDEKYPEALTAAEAQLKIKDSVRNHIAVAKVYEKLNRLDKAQAHTEAAVKLDAKDFLANLSAAIIVLKRGTDDKALQQAKPLLDRANEAEGHPASQGEWIDWNVTIGIFYALADETASARRELKRVLEVDPENETAKAALAMVGN